MQEQVSESGLIFHSKNLMLNSPHPLVVWNSDHMTNLLKQHHLHKTHRWGRLRKTNIYQKMLENDIPIPETWEVNARPFDSLHYPVVLKHEYGTLGMSNFLITEPSHLAMFFTTPVPLERSESIVKSKADQKKRIPVPKDYFLQEFIPNPSDHFCHIRVFTVGDQIVTASFHVSEDPKSNKHVTFHPGENIHDYLKSIKFSSNRAQGAYQIPLTTNPVWTLSPRSVEALESHGINPQKPRLPKFIQELAEKAGRIASGNGIVIGGQDYILSDPQTAYFLEINSSPNLNTFKHGFKPNHTPPPGLLEVNAARLISDALLSYQPSTSAP